MKKIIFFAVMILSAFMTYPDDDYSSLFGDVSSDASGDSKTVETITETEKSYDFSFGIYGEHGFGFHIPVISEHMDFAGNIKAPRFSNDLGIEINYKQLKAVAGVKMDILLNDFSVWYNVIKIRPLENYISWSPWKFTFAVGLQKYSWGLADGMNPTDNINPHDYTTGAESEKLSALSAAIKFYPVNFFSMEAVYLPFEQNDIFPKDVKNEIPAELFYGKMFNGTSVVPVAANKNVEYKQLNFDPSNFILGGKTNFFFKSVDFSFSYLYDIDPYWTPEITINRSQITPLPMYIYNVSEIKLVRNRIHRFGTDIKYNVDKFGMWLELCYSMSDDYLMNSYKKRNHKLSWVTGFDFNAGPEDLVYFNFQIMGEFIPGFDDRFYKDYKDGLPDQSKVDDKTYMEEFYYRALTDRIGNYSEGVNLGASLNVKFNILNNLLTPSLTAAYTVPSMYDYDRGARYGAFYLKPELDIMPVDSFHISIGADLYFAWKKDGDKIVSDSTYKVGNFQNDSSIYILVKYKWDYELKK